METLDLQQGSEEWLNVRGKYNTASEAPVMIGVSSKCTRTELIRMKATGDDKQFSQWVKDVLFERGKEIEIKAREIIEERIGEDLFPVTGILENLLASFDGLTFERDVVWECKQWNQDKFDLVSRGEMPEEDKWQVVQQLVVSGADKALYTISDGTPENTISMEYKLGEGDLMALLAGWKQFNEDVENYSTVEVAKEVVGRAPDKLPSLTIIVKGSVTQSNLTTFKEITMGALSNINRDLKTDTDFADAEKTVKWCQGVEKKLKESKENALSQTQSIEQLFITIDSISEETRVIRLELDKLVKSRKIEIRNEILQEAKTQYLAYVAKKNKGLKPGRLPEIVTNFKGVMKGKRTVKSLNAAVDDEVARLKIEVTEISDLMLSNIAHYKTIDKAYFHLFPEIHTLLNKSHDDFKNLISFRVSEFERKEAERLKAETEKIEREVTEKLQREQAAENERVAGIKERIEAFGPLSSELYSYNDKPKDLGVLKENLQKAVSCLIDDSWGEFKDDAAQAKDLAVKALTSLIEVKEKEVAEAERVRLEKEAEAKKPAEPEPVNNPESALETVVIPTREAPPQVERRAAPIPTIKESHNRELQGLIQSMAVEVNQITGLGDCMILVSYEPDGESIVFESNKSSEAAINTLKLLEDNLE